MQLVREKPKYMELPIQRSGSILQLCFQAFALLDNVIDERAYATIDPYGDLVTILQVDGWLLHKADTFRRPSHDDGTRQKSCALREERDGLTDREELVARVSVLKSTAVYDTLQGKVLWVRDG